MTKTEFKRMVKRMVRTYDIDSYLENDEDVAEGNLWFQCPECGDVIAFEDWEDDYDLTNGVCPICGNELEVE